MKFDTICVQGAHKPAKNRNTPPVPIYQTTAFSFDSVQYAADLFDLKASGDIYTRLSNPTTNTLEERLAMLEGGVGALAVSSGQSASLIAVLNIAKSGDEIVASTNMYGGTVNLMNVTLRKMGIETKFVSSDKAEDFEAQITDKTRCIFVEMLNNPSLKIADIENIAKVAHAHNIPLIVDNTITTPYLCRPIEFGADIVVHSLTKYICGHGTSMGGVIVDSGNFDWTKSGKFPELTEPDESYHGTKYVEAFGKMAYIVKARAQMIRDLGTCISPMNSFLIIQGLETLSLRMERLSQTALKVAKFLENHPAVAWVNYPMLENSDYHKLALKYMPKGCSSIVSFGIKNGKSAGVKFIEHLTLPIHATNIGDSRTIITYPALTTHRQLTDEQMKECGIGTDFMRLSVGLEDVDDILQDLDNALKFSQK
ncbi:MAG: bifunctional O-acetylhomoserine aminocarboxypropyltransferase/cysteine synthase [Candidatus Melainabacteria bacterium]|mgnify:FL=1|nr:MAG: bifunctional O-acetylhomoserine aminocarboxypropyltransferase/cysteine synthase [Candidatus Melainabacteria bacterium]